MHLVAPKSGSKAAVIIALGLLVISAVVITEYAYAVVPETSDDGALLSLSNIGFETADSTANVTTGAQPASMHTMISVVLIMSLVMVGLVILGWDKKKK